MDQRRTVVWVLGGLDDAPRRRRLGKVGVSCRTFVTDDWEDCHRVIPEMPLFTGKDLTLPIEQDNIDIRHCLARFRRRTQVFSTCNTVIDLSLLLLHYLQQPAAFLSYARKLANTLNNSQTDFVDHLPS